MRWMNSVPIFHNDVMNILLPEVPHLTVPYINDVPIKGPWLKYQNKDGTFEIIPDNPRICRFVWVYFQGINWVVQQMKYSGETFLGFKSVLCAPEIMVLVHQCTEEGRLPDPTQIDKVSNWGPCIDLSNVQAFLGKIGVCRMFIKNFTHWAHQLVKLTRKDQLFEFRPEQLKPQEDLKQAKPQDHWSFSQYCFIPGVRLSWGDLNLTNLSLLLRSNEIFEVTDLICW